MRTFFLFLTAILASTALQAQIKFSVGPTEADAKHVYSAQGTDFFYFKADGTETVLLGMEGSKAILDFKNDRKPVLTLVDDRLYLGDHESADYLLLSMDESGITDHRLDRGQAFQVGTRTAQHLEMDFSIAGGGKLNMYYSSTPTDEQLLMAAYLAFYDDFIPK